MRFLTTFAASLLFATAAQAHSGDTTSAGIAHDALHMLGGADHGLALVGLGLLVALMIGAPLIAGRLARRAGRTKTRG